MKRHFDFIGWQHIRLPAGMTVEGGLVRYKNHPDVLATEPNFIHERVAAAVPNDPLFAQQYALERIGAPTAWNLTTGSSNVVVALLDTGINYNHEDLRPNMWRNPGEIPDNGIDDDGNGYVDDVYGIDTADDAFGNDSDPMDEGAGGFYYGTACAGIIGAAGNNNTGVTGINWSVQLMALRGIKINDTVSNADAIEALDYIVLMKQRGVNLRVVSMSFGGGRTYSQAQKDAHDRVASEGILQIASAASNGLDLDANPRYPASYDTSNFIAVAASTSSDDLASFSNYGRTNVDLAAPGVSVFTTDGSRTNSYAPIGGTEAAAAHVAGAAALIATAYPSLSAEQIKAVILDSVDVLPAFTYKVVSNGRLNVGRALYFADPGINAPPVIVLEPQGRSIDEGDSVTFMVIASGTPPLRYRWQFNDADIPGATNSALQLSNATTNEAGGYHVLLTNAFGGATSVVATLTVTPESNPVFTRVIDSPLVMVPGNATSAVWGDYDDDGDVDLFVPRGLGNENDLFFRNEGDGNFTHLTNSILAMDNADSFSGAWGDYDNDGDLDLLVANGTGQNEFLYRSENDGNFTEIATQARISAGGNSFDCAWVDYDNDGWLDALISNGGFSGNDNEFLFHNNGDGTFTQITDSVIANNRGRSYGVAWGDYDSDGLPDLFLANAFGQTNRLYHNDGNGAFTSIMTGELVTEPGFSTGGAWGDYDNDGDLDLYVTRHGSNLLYRNEDDGTFTRITAGAIVNDVADSNSAAWGDYDNDGFLDLFVANQTSESDFLYHNNGDGSFRKITASIVAKDGKTSVGCSWVDYDNDGHLDLFVPCLENQATSLLYQNNGNSNGWLKVKCVGSASNRSGIGAKVRVRTNIGGTNRWQLRQISGGGGFGSQLQLVAHFGLGDAAVADIVRIEWPSGTVQELQNVTTNQCLTVTELPGLTAVGMVAFGEFSLILKGGPGRFYTIEYSTDLIHWNPLTAFTATEKATLVSDPNAPLDLSRFYRAREGN